MHDVATPSEAAARCAGDVYVAVDIGGTNTRVALIAAADAARGSVGSAVVVVKKTNVMAVVLGFLREVEAAVGARVLGAAVAGPGPRDAASTQLGPFSNFTEACRVLKRSDLPTQLFPPGRTAMLNDLEAAAYGITAVAQQGPRFASVFTKMWGSQAGDAMHLQRGPYLILAVGTGLGSGLVHLVDGRVSVMPLEFGHTSIVPEKVDVKFLDAVSAELYSGGKMPEYEDVVAGRGLVRAYNFYRKESGGTKAAPPLDDAAAVAARAKQGCGVALRAMWVHYKYLLHLASDLAMGFVLGGVVLAGDNVLHNDFFVSRPDVAARLERHFNSHTMNRLGFQSRVDVLRQTQKCKLNLEGAFYKAREAAGNTPAAKL